MAHLHSEFISKVKYPEFERAMQVLISQALVAHVPLSDTIIQEKGVYFASALGIDSPLKHSNGWLYKLKKRIGLRRINYSGEAYSAPLESLHIERARLQGFLSQYDRNDIYTCNADETGLFYRMEPNQTLATSCISGRKKVSVGCI